jgi:hypothetical protein
MYFTPQLMAFEVDGNREFHHWSPSSEKFASGSQLYSAVIHGGWNISQHVIQRVVDFPGGRRTRIYYFELQRNDDYMTMPVIESPAVFRFVHIEPFLLAEYEEIQLPDVRVRLANA